MKVPQSVGGLGLLPPHGLQRTEKHLLLIIYLPGASCLRSGDLGVGRDTAGAVNWCLPSALRLSPGITLKR